MTDVKKLKDREIVDELYDLFQPDARTNALLKEMVDRKTIPLPIKSAIADFWAMITDSQKKS